MANYLPVLFACLATFVVALDETILSTVIPTITSEFNSIQDIAWYGSAYTMTHCAFGLIFSKIYDTASIKHSFITAVILFEVGSVICATAQQSYQLILGRAIAGIGGGGIGLGTSLILDGTFNSDKTTLYLQLPVVIWAVASGVGPIIGGALTQRASWRICFYINVPVGVVVIIAIAATMKIQPPMDTQSPQHTSQAIVSRITSLNIPEATIILGAIITLIIALQKGSTDGWGNRIVIAFILCSVILFAIFVALQIIDRPRSNTIIPPDIIKNPIIALGSIISLSNGTPYTIFIYILPLYLQLVKHQTPEGSGMLLLIFTLTVSLSSIAGGYFLHVRPRIWRHHLRLGNLIQQIFIGTLITLGGAVSLTQLTIATSNAIFILCELAAGVGIGLVMVLPIAAAKEVLPNDMRYTVATLQFFRALGSIIGLSLAQILYNGNSGDENIKVKRALYVAVAFGVLGLLSSLRMILLSKKQDKQTEAAEAAPSGVTGRTQESEYDIPLHIRHNV